MDSCELTTWERQEPLRTQPREGTFDGRSPETHSSCPAFPEKTAQYDVREGKREESVLQRLACLPRRACGGKAEPEPPNGVDLEDDLHVSEIGSFDPLENPRRTTDGLRYGTVTEVVVFPNQGPTLRDREC